jgi:hypothetical protein
MEFNKILTQFRLKLDNVFFVSFATNKNLPCCKKIFYLYDIAIITSKHFKCNERSIHTHTHTHTHTLQIPLVLVRAKEAYREWNKGLANLKRIDRYTLGSRIDEVFLSLLELIFRACFVPDKFEKLSLVGQSIGKADLLKFFFQLGWEQKTIDHKTYGRLILSLDEVGRMLGGWKKSLGEKTPTNK